MIEGATIPLYASPDAYFHPSYNPTTGTGITTGFTWSWTETTATLTFSQNDANDNYVEVTAPAGSAGSYTVNVTENSPFGTCNNGGRDIAINVVTAPSVAHANTSVEACEGAPGIPGIIEAVISGGYRYYRLAWTLQIRTVDGATVHYYDDENGNGQAGTPKFAVNNTLASPDAVGVSGNYDITTVSDFLVINNGTRDATTIYTYTLNGINDQASRWSDFLSLAAGSGVNGVAANNFTYYDTGADAITITVHPTPTTGPIFHIDANWAN